MGGSAKPLIAVSRCSRMDDYLHSLARAGAVARVVEVTESAADVAAQVNGILLTGGGDVDPRLYGEPRHPATRDAEPGRDTFEIALVRAALEADLPLLAICRGAQVLNVATGGTLVQHIPDALAAPLAHAVPQPADGACHAVLLDPGSRLAAALGRADAARSRCGVNSRHHQAVHRLGHGLAVSATADDGVIEGIERPEARFCVGVQWHPENFWRTDAFTGLFDAFVAAAALGRQRPA